MNRHVHRAYFARFAVIQGYRPHYGNLSTIFESNIDLRLGQSEEV